MFVLKATTIANCSSSSSEHSCTQTQLVLTILVLPLMSNCALPLAIFQNHHNNNNKKQNNENNNNNNNNPHNQPSQRRESGNRNGYHESSTAAHSHFHRNGSEIGSGRSSIPTHSYDFRRLSSGEVLPEASRIAVCLKNWGDCEGAEKVPASSNNLGGLKWHWTLPLPMQLPASTNNSNSRRNSSSKPNGQSSGYWGDIFEMILCMLAAICIEIVPPLLRYMRQRTLLLCRRWQMRYRSESTAKEKQQQQQQEQRPLSTLGPCRMREFCCSSRLTGKLLTEWIMEVLLLLTTTATKTPYANTNNNNNSEKTIFLLASVPRRRKSTLCFYILVPQWQQQQQQQHQLGTARIESNNNCSAHCGNMYQQQKNALKIATCLKTAPTNHKAATTKTPLSNCCYGTATNNIKQRRQEFFYCCSCSVCCCRFCCCCCCCCCTHSYCCYRCCCTIQNKARCCSNYNNTDNNNSNNRTCSSPSQSSNRKVTACRSPTLQQQHQNSPLPPPKQPPQSFCYQRAQYCACDNTYCCSLPRWLCNARKKYQQRQQQQRQCSPSAKVPDCCSDEKPSSRWTRRLRQWLQTIAEQQCRRLLALLLQAKPSDASTNQSQSQAAQQQVQSQFHSGAGSGKNSAARAPMLCMANDQQLKTNNLCKIFCNNRKRHRRRRRRRRRRSIRKQQEQQQQMQMQQQLWQLSDCHECQLQQQQIQQPQKQQIASLSNAFSTIINPPRAISSKISSSSPTTNHAKPPPPPAQTLMMPTATSPSTRVYRRRTKPNLVWLFIGLVWFEGPKFVNCSGSTAATAAAAQSPQPQAAATAAAAAAAAAATQQAPADTQQQQERNHHQQQQKFKQRKQQQQQEKQQHQQQTFDYATEQMLETAGGEFNIQTQNHKQKQNHKNHNNNNKKFNYHLNNKNKKNSLIESDDQKQQQQQQLPHQHRMAHCMPSIVKITHMKRTAYHENEHSASSSTSASSPYQYDPLYEDEVQLREQASSAQSDSVRLESIKRQILTKLGLTRKPNVSHPLPKQFIWDTIYRADGIRSVVGDFDLTNAARMEQQLHLQRVLGPEHQTTFAVSATRRKYNNKNSNNLPFNAAGKMVTAAAAFYNRSNGEQWNNNNKIDQLTYLMQIRKNNPPPMGSGNEMETLLLGAGKRRRYEEDGDEVDSADESDSEAFNEATQGVYQHQHHHHHQPPEHQYPKPHHSHAHQSGSYANAPPEQDMYESEDFFGNTQEIITFAERGHMYKHHRLVEFSPQTNEGPHQKLFIRNAEIHIRVDQVPPPHGGKKQTAPPGGKLKIWIFQLLGYNNTHKGFDQMAQLSASFNVDRRQLGWQKFDLTETVRRWYEQRPLDKLRLLIDCTGCGKQFALHLFDQPTTKAKGKASRKRKQKMSTTSASGIAQNTNKIARKRAIYQFLLPAPHSHPHPHANCPQPPRGPEAFERYNGTHQYDTAPHKQRRAAESNSHSPYRPFLVLHTETKRLRRVRRRAIDCMGALHGQCCKESFYVSFKALGWDDWIIAPRGYFANYCRGDCTGPFRTPDTFQTFHAHFIEEYRKMGLLNGMQPCCAPVKFSSMSLIYYGDDGIIKRDLPKMVVDECGCP